MQENTTKPDINSIIKEIERRKPLFTTNLFLNH